MLQKAQMEIAADNPMYAAPAASPEAVNQGAVDDLTKRLDALMPGLWFVCWLVMLGRGVVYRVTIVAYTIITIVACTIITILHILSLPAYYHHHHFAYHHYFKRHRC